MNPQSEYEIEDALAHTIDERDCLLPDDDTAVDVLAAILHDQNHPAIPDCELGRGGTWTDPPGPPPWVGRKKCVVDAEYIIERLREGWPR